MYFLGSFMRDLCFYLDQTVRRLYSSLTRGKVLCTICPQVWKLKISVPGIYSILNSFLIPSKTFSSKVALKVETSSLGGAGYSQSPLALILVLISSVVVFSCCINYSLVDVYYLNLSWLSALSYSAGFVNFIFPQESS